MQSRTDTALTWEQLRSPQVTQFLVKPMLQQIRSNHFSRATVYTLLVNALQFSKESSAASRWRWSGRGAGGGSGTAKNPDTCATRALVCEMLALKLLKEYTTRELVDALAYDFYPLQGMPGPGGSALQVVSGGAGGASSKGKGRSGLGSGGGSSGGNVPFAAVARTSTLEVAIRASAKHFLAHPLVVQHLQAIWMGAIVFPTVSDTLHRIPRVPALQSVPPSTPTPLASLTSQTAARSRRQSVLDKRTPLLGRVGSGSQLATASAAAPKEAASATVTPALQLQAQSQPGYGSIAPSTAGARTGVATLYDPHTASPFKLSRLRVPRYRRLVSTLSLGVLVGLLVAVLAQRSTRITTLELVFWLWSAGYMLDELVAITDQGGVALHVMGPWNLFDLGVVALLIVYYCMRAVSVFLVDRRHYWNDTAYDVLAANTILLLPRILGILDHYPYFAQLLIAFRLMAVDLAAVFVVIGITCGSFFAFFALSKGPQDAADVAYRIFQMLMGYTDPAWEV